MSTKRVVVTGLGMVTPLADGVQQTWKKLTNAECGIKFVDAFDVSDLPVKIAAMLPKSSELGFFDLTKYVSDLKEHKKIENFIAFGIAASVQAVEDSGICELSDDEKQRIGVMIGSGIGGLSAIERNSIFLHGGGYRKVTPFFIPSSLINLTSGHIAIRYGFGGVSDSTVTACATGLSAIVHATRMIKYGEAEVLIAGSSEAAVCRIGISGFGSMRALSTKNDSPGQASRPWDKSRDGFVMGEGAASLVLEEYEHAKRRNAKIYAEILGYGCTCDTYHIVAPDPEGLAAARAMKDALQMSYKKPEDIGYINAHSTSTPAGDISEMKAIINVFNKDSKVAISSTKGAIGHLLGAAGSVEAVFAILAMYHSVVPPTINLDDPEDICLGMNLVPKISQEHKMTSVMSNSFGFGGTNYSIVFGSV